MIAMERNVTLKKVSKPLTFHGLDGYSLIGAVPRSVARKPSLKEAGYLEWCEQDSSCMYVTRSTVRSEWQ